MATRLKTLLHQGCTSLSTCRVISFILPALLLITPFFKIDNVFEEDFHLNRYLYAGVLSGLILVTLALISIKASRNFITQNFSNKQVLWYFLFASLILFAGNPELLKPSHWNHIPHTIIFALSLILLVQGLLKRSSFIVWYIILLLPGLEFIIACKYGYTLEPAVMAEIIGASPQDIALFASVENISLFLVLVVISMIAFTLLSRTMPGLPRRVCVISGSILLVIACGNAWISSRPLWADNLLAHIGAEKKVLSIFHAVKLARLKNTALMKDCENLPSPMLKKSKIRGDIEHKNVICILHIGESVRADRLPFNGYERNTMPWVNAQPELINYKKCTSASSRTVSSFVSILTNARGNMDFSQSPELLPTCGSVIDLFAANGFHCSAFMSSVASARNETWGAVFEQLCKKVFLKQVDKAYDLPSHDAMEQIPLITGELAHSPHQNRFLILNNEGSHLPFSGYDHEHPYYTPSSPSAYGKNPAQNPRMAQQASNAYDNTLRYTDEYIKKLISSLQGKPYVYVFISDHGENLGEKGVWKRVADVRQYFSSTACQIPFFVLYSPEFENSNPHVKQALKNLRKHRTMSIAHEHIFHTLLGLFAIESEYYDETLDLCSDKVREYMGPHPSRGGKSLDGLIWYK